MKFNLMTIPKLGASDERREELRPIGRNTEEYVRMLDELDQIVLMADELGYDSYSTTEHHFHTEGVEVMPSPMLFYTRLAAMTKNIKFMPLSIVLPASNPLRVAEDIALFDNMFRGRIMVGFARGYQNKWMQVISQRESIASGMPKSDALNREIFEEYLDVVLKAWTEDSFSFNGKHFKVPFPAEGIDDWAVANISARYGTTTEIDADGVVREIGVVPSPYTKPHPQIWLPFSYSPQTLSNAARRGFNMLLLPSEPTAVREFCERYQSEAAEAGRDLKLGEGICAVRQLAIGDTYEEAFDIAVRSSGWDFQKYFQEFGNMEAWRTPEDDPNNKPLRFPTPEAATQRLVGEGFIICGTVDDVKRQIEKERLCGADGDLEYMSWNFYPQGNLTFDEQRRQLELFGTQIMPEFV